MTNSEIEIQINKLQNNISELYGDISDIKSELEDMDELIVKLNEQKTNMASTMDETLNQSLQRSNSMVACESFKEKYLENVKNIIYGNSMDQASTEISTMLTNVKSQYISYEDQIEDKEKVISYKKQQITNLKAQIVAEEI